MACYEVKLFLPKMKQTASVALRYTKAFFIFNYFKMNTFSMICTYGKKTIN